MHYFFKQHEENFKEWRNPEYQSIPDTGIDFIKHLGSRNFKPDLKIVKFWNEKQWKKVQLEAIYKLCEAWLRTTLNFNDGYQISIIFNV